jgi:hypothetical protein
MSQATVEPIDEGEPRTHYHFRISLRVRHPVIDPEKISEILALKPKRSWKAGEPRQTPVGRPIAGFHQNTYWTAEIAAGRWPLNMNDAISDALKRLVRCRSFLHQVRREGGAAELFIGWFLENQSGDVLTHECLALAGDLQIDLSFDVYPPEQPQQEYDVGGGGVPE